MVLSLMDMPKNAPHLCIKCLFHFYNFCSGFLKTCNKVLFTLSSFLFSNLWYTVHMNMKEGQDI